MDVANTLTYTAAYYFKATVTGIKIVWVHAPVESFLQEQVWAEFTHDFWKLDH